jgi:DNA polymerase zeta
VQQLGGPATAAIGWALGMERLVLLLAKKRYVGSCFETLDQAEPKLDSKGIEVVRRDGCQIAAKMLERSLRVLFEFKDAEKVKNYVKRHCARIVQGKCNLKDFIIAKEYRGRDSYHNVKSIAACQIADRNLVEDPLAEPLSGERVPYLIAYGPPGLPLYELVRSPHDFAKNSELKLNYEYYIVKQILPPLDRIMSLIGVNVFEWVSQMSFKPKVFHRAAFELGESSLESHQQQSKANFGLKTLTSYFYTVDCILCGLKCNVSKDGANASKQKKGLCDSCAQLDQNTIIKLKLKFKRAETRFNQLTKVCQMCTANVQYGNQSLECSSFDCPNMYLCSTTKNNFSKIDYLRKIIDEFF